MASSKKTRNTKDARQNNENESTSPQQENKKTIDLGKHTVSDEDQFLTTNQGLRIANDQNSLKAGERGATLMEDFIFREKMTHFDHERIPERVVHARGHAAHGVFKLFKPLGQYTRAKFLNDTSLETPVFVRFSTVAGSRGSSDLARDVRGFAVKFYTEEGNFDLVGNNIPVFFIQDAIKFPDLVHAVKAEPHNEIPQAASAHDTFWDFISTSPEASHMIMWQMSDRTIPRSSMTMEGFGVHTFRFVNEAGEAHFVKFHWKPVSGVHSVAWDEATIISGKDPDFHRREMWEAIERGDFPEWEFGVQIVPEADEHKFEFDLLDPTKIIPEELVPVQRIGKMTLNRNPDNFFAETEQVAFHPGHIVPGIDFTNDPLLQGRLFSYTDTQLIRLGGPNFHEIPINRPIAPIHNNQRDGYMRQTINRGRVSYGPNTMANGCPFQAGKMQGGFDSYPERVDARKVRARSASFFDHFSQAKLFFNSQSEPEKQHIIDAFRFELGKVETIEVQKRMLYLLAHIDKGLAAQVAYGLGQSIPEDVGLFNQQVPADADPAAFQPEEIEGSLTRSEALSMAHYTLDNLKGRKLAVLAADGVSEESLSAVLNAVEAAGGVVEIIAPRLGTITGDGGTSIKVDKSLLTTASVFYDAVYVPDGVNSVAALECEADAVHFLNQAFKHCKAIAAASGAMQILEATYFRKKLPEYFNNATTEEEGVVVGSDAAAVAEGLVAAMKKHRFWLREKPRKVPA